MKKILSLILSSVAFLALLISCEDFNDQFTGLNDSVKPTNLVKYSYELVDVDYSTISKSALLYATDAVDSAIAKSIGTNKYFSTTVPAFNYVPLLLKTKYPYGDFGSSANVTFKSNLFDLTYLTDITGATKYTLSNSDYSSVGEKVALTKCFTPSFSAETYIPRILGTAISSPTEGKFALVTYKSTDIEPVSSEIPTISTVFSDDFEDGTLDKYEAFSVKGAQVWASSSYGGTKFAKISGYASGNNENEDWLIIPSLNLSTTAVATLSFSSAFKYTGNKLVLKYSTNYDGGSDPTGFTWTDLSFNMEAGSGTFLWTPSGNINIPGMPNSNVSIAFVYTSTTAAASTWEIDNILITSKNSNAEIPVSVRNDFYKYTNNSWVKPSNITCIQPSEFEQMGLTSGSFSSSNPPANYLPIFLKNKYPLASEGTIKVVGYNYSGTPSLRADEYRYIAGVWSAYTGIVNKTEQYIFSVDGWVFDPTVTIDMVASDYKIMVDYVLATPEIAIFAHPYYKNEEYYWGFNNRYSNINLRLSYRNPYFSGIYVQPSTIDPELNALTTNEAKVEFMWTRLKGGMEKFLQLRFPNAVPLVSGIEVNYIILTKVYYPDGVTNVTSTYKYTYKCTAEGTPPLFEFVSVEKVN